jgi:hypothetical protein
MGLEAAAGVEPANRGFADLRLSHLATPPSADQYTGVARPDQGGNDAAGRPGCRLTKTGGLDTFIGTEGGNNSVVECDLAKVEVAGSNPVSRSKPFP